MRPVYPSIEIPQEEYLSCYTASTGVPEFPGMELVDSTLCDPNNGGIGTAQYRVEEPKFVASFKRKAADHYPIFANTGRVEAFDHKKVLWVFNALDDRRFKGKLPGRLYVFADYFGVVQKSCWAQNVKKLPGEYLQFMSAPIPSHKPVLVDMPLGGPETL